MKTVKVTAKEKKRKVNEIRTIMYRKVDIIIKIRVMKEGSVYK